MDNNNQMFEIKSGQDVKKFAGYFIAYQPKSCYLGAVAGYSIKNNGVKYGWISKDSYTWGSGQGFLLRQLLKKSELHSHKLLDNETISEYEEGVFLIRAATESEIKEIIKTIDHDEAEFDYMNFDKALLQKINSLLIEKKCFAKL